MLKMDENVNLRLERDVNGAFFFYCLLYIVSSLAATAMATAMLKMDEMLIFNYNNMLTGLFFAVYGFSPGTGLYIFQNIR